MWRKDNEPTEKEISTIRKERQARTGNSGTKQMFPVKAPTPEQKEWKKEQENAVTNLTRWRRNR